MQNLCEKWNAGELALYNVKNEKGSARRVSQAVGRTVGFIWPVEAELVLHLHNAVSFISMPDWCVHGSWARSVQCSSQLSC